MSTTNTYMAPSYGSRNARPGGSRGGARDHRRDDDDDDWRPQIDKKEWGPRPTDTFNLVDFGPNGWVRGLLLSQMRGANVGQPPSGSLLTNNRKTARGHRCLKSEADQIAAIQTWVNSMLTTPDKYLHRNFSPLAEHFVRTLRMLSAAGFYDQVIALLRELRVAEAQKIIDAEQDDEPYYSDDPGPCG